MPHKLSYVELYRFNLSGMLQLIQIIPKTFMASLSTVGRLLLVVLVGGSLCACEVKVNTSGESATKPAETAKESPSSKPASPPKDALDSPEAYYSRGVDRFGAQDNNGAIADFSEAIRLKPEYAEAYFNRGTAYTLTKDYAASINDFNQFIRLKPDNALGYFKRGMSKMFTSDKPGAIADLTQAMTIDPEYADPYVSRGLTKAELGDKQGAKADIDKALELYKKQGKTKEYNDVMDLMKSVGL
jgi:tetratricopeptide (TPR) repeat protein